MYKRIILGVLATLIAARFAGTLIYDWYLVNSALHMNDKTQRITATVLNTDFHSNSKRSFGSQLYNVSYQFQVPNDSKIYFGKDRILGDKHHEAVPRALQIRYSVTNPAYSQLAARPFYAIDRLFVLMLATILFLVTYTSAIYYLLRLSLSKKMQIIAIQSFIGTLAAIFFIIYST